MKINNFIKKIFFNKEKLSKNCKIRMIDGLLCWFINFDNRRLVYFSQNIPKIGDLFFCEMLSGKTGVFEAITINYTDVRDMFFLDLKDLGYKEDLNLG